MKLVRRYVLPAVVLVALLGGTVATTVLMRRNVAQQEARILRERTAEGAATLRSAIGNFTTELTFLAALARAEPDVQHLRAIIRAVAGDGALGTTALEARPQGFVVVIDTTGQRAEGAAVPAADAAIADRALRADGVVTGIARDRLSARVVFAINARTPSPLVFVLGFPVDPSVGQSANVFSELDGAVYAGPREDRDALVLATTRDLPIAGHPVERLTVPVGVDEWLLVTTPARQLVGSLAAAMPWIILAGGLVSAVLVAALVATLSRRRAYALALVEERTAELRDVLNEQRELERREREARRAAEAANHAKNEFLSRMSHELRTPLNAVLGFAQLLELEDLPRAQRESVEQILRGGRHLLDLINEVLEISRIETGTIALSPEPVQAAEVMAEVVDLARPLATHLGVRLDVDAAGDAHVQADRQRLRQILLNLLSNAIKFNRAGGSVHVTYEHVGEHSLRIVVADTGFGIGRDDLDRLFVPFERLDAEARGVEGMGIGLALSRRLAEAMGGTLDVTSETGVGSTFWVELPIVEAPLERYERLHVPPAARPDQPTAPDRERRKVLYIEDNVPNLRLVERVLERNEHLEVVAAMQGRLGLELACDLRPAAVLLDLHLPDISGEEVLRRLRDDPRTASIPVVVLTADATKGQARRLLGAGAAAYLSKPLDVRQLTQLLDDLLVDV